MYSISRILARIGDNPNSFASVLSNYFVGTWFNWVDVAWHIMQLDAAFVLVKPDLLFHLSLSALIGSLLQFAAHLTVIVMAVVLLFGP